MILTVSHSFSCLIQIFIGPFCNMNGHFDILCALCAALLSFSSLLPPLFKQPRMFINAATSSTLSLGSLLGFLLGIHIRGCHRFCRSGETFQALRCLTCFFFNHLYPSVRCTAGESLLHRTKDTLRCLLRLLVHRYLVRNHQRENVASHQVSLYPTFLHQSYSHCLDQSSSHCHQNPRSHSTYFA